MPSARPKRTKPSSGRKGKDFLGNIHVVLGVRLAIVLVLFFLSRICFYLFNLNYFSGLGFTEALNLFIRGVRFDLSGLLIINTPFILMYILPLRIREKKWYLRVANGYFIFINIIALLSNFVDTVYFRFTLKRTTADIFQYLEVGGDFDRLVPQFLRDFWYVILVFLFFCAVLVYFFSRVNVTTTGPGSAKGSFGYYLLQGALFLLIGFFWVIGIRGGFQLRPISLVTAGKHTASKYVPLLLNSPFSIAKTVGHESLKVVTWFKKESELAAVYSPVHKGKNGPLKSLNVVIIILESVSREHIGRLNPDLENGSYKGYTPFLDSLIGEGYYFDAFANGKTSIQGIPAILSGIPSLMNESFIQSNYASDRYSGIAGILKARGYHTAFFHGGTNGTMGFDAYSRTAGFDHYFGRSEYNNEKDYDGKWGIRDEEFFRFAARKMDEMPRPFLTALFSLSSHHPYYVPAKYNGRFRKGKLPIQESVMYTDFSLGRFFHAMKDKPWFGNTLFVITADHTSEGYYPYYQTTAGQYAIPLLFYRGDSSLKGRSGKTAQQTDILPTVLGYLDYDRPYIAFGSDLFDPVQPGFSVHYLSGIYGLMKEGFYFESDGMNGISLYDFRNDRLQKVNIISRETERAGSLKHFLKAYIQQYNNRLIENRLTAE